MGDADQEDVPALVVTFGTTAKKRRPLGKPTNLLGRGRGCDIRLDAVEISAIHCVISQTNAGLIVRDCESRTGTLVNDQPVREAVLADGDLLQLGPFSFKVSIPPKWLESRNLLETTRAATSGPASSARETGEDAIASARMAELAEREQQIARAQSEVEKLRENLERQRRELNDERAADIDYVEAYKEEIDQLKESLAAQVERCQALEAEKESLAAELTARVELVISEGAATQIRLKQAYEEIERLQQRLEQAEFSESRGSASMVEAGAGLPAEASIQIEELKQKVSDSTTVNEQLRTRLESEHSDSERRLTAMRKELEEERMRVKQLVREAASQYSATKSEIDGLRAQLAAAQTGMGGETADPGMMGAEVEMLRTMVTELQAQLEAARAEAPLPPDLADYENQLNEFRAQLEHAQAGLQQQEADMQERIRQNELQISRERAEVGRERATLERMRQEVRSELEHAEREAKNFERLSGVHRLANEVRGQGKPEEQTDNTLSAKIRGFLKRMGS